MARCHHPFVVQSSWLYGVAAACRVQAGQASTGGLGLAVAAHAAMLAVLCCTSLRYHSCCRNSDYLTYDQAAARALVFTNVVFLLRAESLSADFLPAAMACLGFAHYLAQGSDTESLRYTVNHSAWHCWTALGTSLTQNNCGLLYVCLMYWVAPLRL